MRASVDKSAQAELAEISKKNKGRLVPEKVLEFARDENTSLHKYITWDETEAAVKYRLEQCKAIIRSVRVEVVDLGGPDREVRAYWNLPTASARDGAYLPISVIREDPELLDELLGTALEELQQFMDKYADLKALTPVFRAVKQVQQAVGRKRERTASTPA